MITERIHSQALERRFSIIKRALLFIQKESGEKIDIHNLTIKENETFLDFIFIYENKFFFAISWSFSVYENNIVELKIESYEHMQV